MQLGSPSFIRITNEQLKERATNYTSEIIIDYMLREGNNKKSFCWFSENGSNQNKANLQENMADIV